MTNIHQQPKAIAFVRSVCNWGGFTSLAQAKCLIRFSAERSGVAVAFGRQVKDGSTPEHLTYVFVRIDGHLVGELVRGPDGWRWWSP